MPARLFDIPIIDLGHGGLIGEVYQTAGKRYTFTNVNPPLTIFEGVIQRQIGARVIRRWLEKGIAPADCVSQRIWRRAPHWRDLEQRDIPLGERVAWANRYPNGIFCSLHSNAFGDGHEGAGESPRGFEVYTSRGQTRADEVATTIHAAIRGASAPLGMLMRSGQWVDNDVDYEAGFYVLKHTWMPAVLVEAGYHTSLRDARFLLSEEGQEAIAAGIVEGQAPWMKALRRRFWPAIAIS